MGMLDVSLYRTETRTSLDEVSLVGARGVKPPGPDLFVPTAWPLQCQVIGPPGVLGAAG